MATDGLPTPEDLGRHPATPGEQPFPSLRPRMGFCLTESRRQQQGAITGRHVAAGYGRSTRRPSSSWGMPPWARESRTTAAVRQRFPSPPTSMYALKSAGRSTISASSHIQGRARRRRRNGGRGGG